MAGGAAGGASGPRLFSEGDGGGRAWAWAARFMAYCGVSCVSLLVPLLVWGATGSMAAAGGAMAIEWVPKLFFYVFGGRAVDRAGAARAVAWADATRALAAGGLLWCVAAGGAPFWLLGLLAAACQCSNAISNIAYEAAVTGLWGAGPGASAGHAALGRADILAGMAVLPLLASAGSRAMAGAAAVFFAMAWVVALKRGRVIFAAIPGSGGGPLPGAGDVLAVGRAARTVFSDKRLSLLVLAGLAMGVPGAFVGSVPSFVIASFDQASAGDPGMLAMVTAGGGVACYVALSLCHRALSSAGWAWAVFAAGASLVFAGLFFLGTAVSWTGFLVGYASLRVGASMASPFMRAARQELMDDSTRASTTGVVIAAEAAGYLVAAGMAAALSGGAASGFALPCAIGLAAALVMALRAGSFGERLSGRKRP